jgi:hypothetical protein
MTLFTGLLPASCLAVARTVRTVPLPGKVATTGASSLISGRSAFASKPQKQSIQKVGKMIFRF